MMTGLTLTGEQEQLRESLLRYLSREYDFVRRGRILAEGGYSATTWRDFAELGWLGAALPEEFGGSGGGPVETMVIMEALGRHIVLEPFLWTVVVGGAILRRGTTGATRQALMEALAEGRLQLALAAQEAGANHDLAKIATTARRQGQGFVLDGRKPVVPNGAVADMLIVAARSAGTVGDRAGITLFRLLRDHPGLAIRPYRTIDGQTAAEVTLHGVAVGSEAVIGDPDDGIVLLEHGAEHGIAAICAEATGSCAHLIDVTARYLQTREQYGAPLARFQVLQHRMADMVIAQELCRSMSVLATHAIGQPEVERRRLLSAAKVQMARSARFIGQQAVQLHGGMGMSEELDIGHHFKRLTMLCLLFGDEAHHLRRFAEASQVA